MKCHQVSSSLTLTTLFFLVSSSCATTTTTGTGECKPSTWTREGDPGIATAKPVAPRFTPSVPRIPGADIQPGNINCRYWSNTYEEVNSNSCAKMADRYGITLEKFFMLNPILDPDCGDIRPNTEYCTAGFIEPLRAWDGRCGPQHNNATCIGMKMGQCCNSETWACGNTAEDCAPGTCYEGVCHGHRVYTTDGRCGHGHGNRLCAGKQGDCCSIHGYCGSGKAFCGEDVCSMGNCNRPLVPRHWIQNMYLPRQDTLDGTCIGQKMYQYTYSLERGQYCNKMGFCRSGPHGCGAGCHDNNPL